MARLYILFSCQPIGNKVKYKGKKNSCNLYFKIKNRRWFDLNGY